MPHCPDDWAGHVSGLGSKAHPSLQHCCSDRCCIAAFLILAGALHPGCCPHELGLLLPVCSCQLASGSFLLVADSLEPRQLCFLGSMSDDLGSFKIMKMDCPIQGLSPLASTFAAPTCLAELVTAVAVLGVSSVRPVQSSKLSYGATESRCGGPRCVQTPGQQLSTRSHIVAVQIDSYSQSHRAYTAWLGCARCHIDLGQTGEGGLGHDLPLLADAAIIVMQTLSALFGPPPTFQACYA